MLKQQKFKKPSDNINSLQDIVQINHKLLEERLWDTIEDLKIIGQIISQQGVKNQEINIYKLQLINALSAVKKEAEHIERIFLRSS